MVSDDWESMTIDELFALREEVAAILKEKLMAKSKIAEQRLRQLEPLSISKFFSIQSRVVTTHDRRARHEERMGIYDDR